MGLRALPTLSSSSRNCCPPSATQLLSASVPARRQAVAPPKIGVWAKAAEKDDEKETEKTKQSLFSSVTEALDFSQVRSAEDAELLDEARKATRAGGQMSRQQYGALRRKIGGTYKDFFKSYVEVEGQYVEEGWVDKTCRVCKKETRGEPRQVDRLGRYAHVACLEKKSQSTNFFSKLFSI